MYFAAERNDRQRLEKENNSLMAKTFAAPSTALVGLQGLKTEVYSLRREKANAELREAEARRELADQISKACPSQHWHCDLSNGMCLLLVLMMAVQGLHMPECP